MSLNQRNDIQISILGSQFGCSIEPHVHINKFIIIQLQAAKALIMHYICVCY